MLQITFNLGFTLNVFRITRPSLPGERVTQALAHFLFFLPRVYEEARVTRVAGLTFPLVNTPGRVTRLPGLTF